MGLLGQKPREAPKIRFENVIVASRAVSRASPASSSVSRLSSPRPISRAPSTAPATAPAVTSQPRAAKSASPLASSSSSSTTTTTTSTTTTTDDLNFPSSNYVHAPSSRKRKAPSAWNRKRRVSGSRERGRRIDFGSDSDDDSLDNQSDGDDWVGGFRKRRRTKCVDDKRRLRDPRAFKDGVHQLQGARFIHAEQVANLELKCEPRLKADEGHVGFEIQYPSLLARERYQLVSGKDMIDAVDSSIEIVRHVSETYLPPDQARRFTDPSNGVIRRLEKASNRNVENVADFKAALRDHNELLLSLVKSGAVAQTLDARTELLPQELVAFILDQVYDRTVAPNIDLLAKYENGSDNVYGELLHPLVSRILVDEVGLKSDHVFVDLGSGVANVVLHAALEIGCESWGCEMMENACNLAEKQLHEFKARCMLWGIRPGQVTLERGDFRKNQGIHAALRRADVVLVNNQAFTAQLNDDLVRMFLDLKSGSKIVSLKSFVRSSTHNINDVATSILDVKELTYPEGGQVSWTNAGGTCCISTRK